METLHEQPEIGNSFPPHESLDTAHAEGMANEFTLEESLTPARLDSSNPGVDVVPIPLDNIRIDWDIYPRESMDSFTEEKYCNDLCNGITLPHPKVEQLGEGIWRVMDGVHTVKAYQRRREIYRLREEEPAGEKLPEISEAELNTVLCVIDNVPEDVDPMLQCARHNMKHGKSLSNGDYRKVARHLYSKWFGSPVTKLAGELGVRWETVNGYVADMVADYNRQRAALILQLHGEGKTQEEIGRLGRDRFEYGTGWSQESISKFLSEHRNSASTGKDKMNSSRSLLAFRNHHTEPVTAVPRVTHSSDGSEDTVNTLELEEKREPRHRTEGEALKVIECTESVMMTGIQYLRPEVRDTYLRALTKLTDITWAKELRLRENEKRR